MHELSLCQSMLNIVNEQIAGKKLIRVKKISLEIGELAAVDPAALHFSFDVVTKGTMAEKALLDIIVVDGEARCSICEKTVKLKRYYDACPDCGQFSLTITQGEALRVKSIEVE